jgi:hypothetical protein
MVAIMRQKQKKVAKPQKLSIARAQSASKEKVEKLFTLVCI